MDEKNDICRSSVDDQDSSTTREQRYKRAGTLEQKESMQYTGIPQRPASDSADHINFRSGSSRTSLDEAVTTQKLKSFTQAEIAAVDSDSVGDAYDADVDDVFDEGIKSTKSMISPQETHPARAQSEREHIYQLFQPWALKTYGDQAKTKTITMRKKARILKALEGKEHSRPDSSKFRFWVKTKAFTTKRPEGFTEVPGSQHKAKPLPPDAVLSDRPGEVDLFVGSTSKGFGKRTFRKVAVVEEFFDIIYNVHMELGGRSGMHAGQKRTYRIITETYAFLPREAVTRFLSTCPECKKNLRPSSPSVSSGHNEEPINESSSEVETLNYSSHTESSIEGGPTKGVPTTATTTTKAKKRRHSQQGDSSKQQPQKLLKLITEPHPQKSEAVAVEPHYPHEDPEHPPSNSDPSRFIRSQTTPPAGPSPLAGLTRQAMFNVNRNKDEQPTVTLPKIRINPHFQRRRRLSSPTLLMPEPVASTSAPFNPLALDFACLKTQESLLRYYEFMRRFYGGTTSGFVPPPNMPMPMPIQVPVPAPVFAPPIYGSPLLQSLRFPASGMQKKPFLASPTLETITEKRNDKQDDDVDKVENKCKKEVDTLTKDDNEKDDEGNKDDDDKEDDDNDNKHTTLSTPPTPKKLKLWTEDATEAESTHSILKKHLRQQPHGSAINLTKSFLHFSSNGGASTSTAIKVECSASATAASTKTSNTCRLTLPHIDATLRIPQISPQTAATSTSTPSATSMSSSLITPSLPPLDLERLKPITSTYLQLTRSMGLSDEDALRFDNLVSKDFKYSL